MFFSHFTRLDFQKTK